MTISKTHREIISEALFSDDEYCVHPTNGPTRVGPISRVSRHGQTFQIRVGTGALGLARWILDDHIVSIHPLSECPDAKVKAERETSRAMLHAMVDEATDSGTCQVEWTNYPRTHHPFGGVTTERSLTVRWSTRD